LETHCDQLDLDCVCNTSTGIKNKIQISSTTHALLIESGKENWVKPRADAVHAKGKGNLRTFWLDPSAKKGSSRDSSSVSGDMSDTQESSSNVAGAAMVQAPSVSRRKKQAVDAVMKESRLVDWIVDMLHEHIRKLVALRKSHSSGADVKYTPPEGRTSLDEVAEVIYLPSFNEKSFAEAADHRQVTIGPQVLRELKEFVAIIASHYHDNPFHNFEHACHVTMATVSFALSLGTHVYIEQ
jgi:hypothetical protein